MRSLRTAALVAIAALMIVAGAFTPATATTPVDPASYFTALFDGFVGDPKSMIALETSTVKESPAASFNQYLTSAAMARLDAGLEAPPAFRVVGGRDAVDVCVGAQCQQFGDFVFTSGLLESYSIEGTSIAGRFGGPSGEIIVGPLSAVSPTSFRRISEDQLAVIVEFRTVGTQVSPAWPEVAYEDPSGATVLLFPASSVFPDVIPADGVLTTVLQFAGVDLGGVLVVPFSGADQVPLEVRVPIALRPLG